MAPRVERVTRAQGMRGLVGLAGLGTSPGHPDTLWVGGGPGAACIEEGVEHADLATFGQIAMFSMLWRWAM